MAGVTGLEPAAFCVTGRRYNQLNYTPVARSENIGMKAHLVKAKEWTGFKFELADPRYSKVLEPLWLRQGLRRTGSVPYSVQY
jgi:hypothetical protein